MTSALASEIASFVPSAKSEPQNVWEKKPLTVSDDLHPSLAHALGSSSGNPNPEFWQMTPILVETLNRRAKLAMDLSEGTVATNVPTKSGVGLVLKLSDQAVARLGSEAPDLGLVSIKIEAIQFYVSQTRLGQIVFELSLNVAEPTTMLVVEVLHCLSHNHSTTENKWRDGLARLDSNNQVGLEIDKGKNVLHPPHRVSLFNLAHELVCGNHQKTCKIDTPRAFTYVLAATEALLTEGERLEAAARLARRLNKDYSPRASLEGVEFANPFETITHACSQEGGAALVSNCASVDFLGTFTRSVGEKAYLTLALLAHKEFHDLVELTQGSAIYIESDQRDTDEVIDKKMALMVGLRERVLNFRLAHRFSLASYTTNHNLVHSAWRKAMKSEEMLTDIVGDVREAETYLSNRHAELAEKYAEEERARAEAERIRVAKQSSWLHGLLGFFAGLEGTRVFVEIVKLMAGVPTNESAAAGQLASTFGRELGKAEHHAVWLPYAEASPLFVGGAVCALVIWFARKGEVAKGE